MVKSSSPRARSQASAGTPASLERFASALHTIASTAICHFGTSHVAARTSSDASGAGRACAVRALPSRVTGVADGSRRATASLTVEPWRKARKSIASPALPQAQQRNRPSWMVSDGEWSGWNGQTYRPVRGGPVASSITRATSARAALARRSAEAVISHLQPPGDPNRDGFDFLSHAGGLSAALLQTGYSFPYLGVSPLRGE